MDVLVPRVGEIIGGSQREERLDVLLERLKECRLNPDDYWWYLDLRRYGTRAALGFRPGIGAGHPADYRDGEYSRRDSVPPHSEKRRVLKVGEPIPVGRSRKSGSQPFTWQAGLV